VHNGRTGAIAKDALELFQLQRRVCDKQGGQVLGLRGIPRHLEALEAVVRLTGMPELSKPRINLAFTARRFCFCTWHWHWLWGWSWSWGSGHFTVLSRHVQHLSRHVLDKYLLCPSKLLLCGLIGVIFPVMYDQAVLFAYVQPPRLNQSGDQGSTFLIPLEPRFNLRIGELPNVPLRRELAGEVPQGFEYSESLVLLQAKRIFQRGKLRMFRYRS
jgi:hypothetical protein